MGHLLIQKILKSYITMLIQFWHQIELTSYMKYVNSLIINVLIISESKLDQTIPNNLIKIPGYHEPLRHDRLINGRNGGGVLMYISEDLAFQQRPEFQSEFFEHVWADVRINGKIFAINGINRPPNAENHNLFMDTSEKILIQLNNYDKAH